MTFQWWHALVILAPILPNFWCIWHIWNHEFEPPERRIYWLVLTVFVPVIGWMLYIAIGRKQALIQE